MYYILSGGVGCGALRRVTFSPGERGEEGGGYAYVLCLGGEGEWGAGGECITLKPPSRKNLLEKDSR